MNFSAVTVFLRFLGEISSITLFSFYLSAFVMVLLLRFFYGLLTGRKSS